MTDPLPPKWIETTLGELGDWRGGTTPSKRNPAYWEDGTIPWVSPKDMKSDILGDAIDKITTRALADGVAAMVPEGSLLIVMRSGILAHSVPVAVAGAEVAINQDIKALIPAEGVDAGFVADQLRARAPELLAHAGKAGTTVESLVLERLKTFRVRLAPAGEQARITRRLSEARTRTKIALEQTQRLTRAVADIRDSLGDRMARGRLTTSGLADGQTGEQVRLDQLLVEPGRTGLSIKGRLDPPGVRALRLSALRGPIVDMADVRYLPTDEERTKHLALRNGDVLISRGSGSRALVSRASRVHKVTEHTIFPDTSFRVRLDADRILPEWFVIVWNAPVTRAAFEGRIRTTAGIWKVGWRDLREVRLRIPSLDEQRDAIEAYRAASARLDLALARRDRATRLLIRFEQAMVAQAFAGHLVPQSDVEEDAAVLLDRIRSRPATAVTRRKRSKLGMASTKDRLRALISTAADAGQTFAEIRYAVPAPYRELRDAVFEALGDGTLRQRFDDKRGTMVLVRAS